MRQHGEAILGRLRAASKARGMATQQLLSRWAAERFLARLSSSAHAGRLILKGGNLFTLWTGDLYRSTSDVDLHGEEADATRMRDILFEVASSILDEEDATTVHLPAAKPKGLVGGHMPGLRVHVQALVGSAKIPFKVDVGFGHAITPGVDVGWFPSVLPEFASFALRAYPRETVVAEKLAVMVEFGEDGTRLRDYYDVWYLSQRFGFSGHVLARAVEKTFARRDARLMLQRTDGYWEKAFSPDFASARRERAWADWVQEHAPLSPAPAFALVLRTVSEFAGPLLGGVQRGERFNQRWIAGAGWKPLYVAIPSRTPKVVGTVTMPIRTTFVRDGYLHQERAVPEKMALSEAPLALPGSAPGL